MDEPSSIRADDLRPDDLISGLGLEMEVVSKTVDVPGQPDEIDLYLRNRGLPSRFARTAVFRLIRRATT